MFRKSASFHKTIITFISCSTKLGFSLRADCIKCRFCTVSQPGVKPLKKTMEVNRQYDGLIPQHLLSSGTSAWKFHNFFYQLNCREPVIEHQRKNGIWFCKIFIFQPEEMIFEGYSKQKKMANSVTMAKALLWLRDKMYLNDDFMPTADSFSTREERKSFLMKRKEPMVIQPFSQEIKDKMNHYLDHYDKNIKDVLLKFCNRFNKASPLSADNMQMMQLDEKIDNNKSETLNESLPENDDDDIVMRNVFTNRPYTEPTMSELLFRDDALKLYLKQRTERIIRDLKYSQLRQKVENLPIHRFREQIIESLKLHRVIVISGDTGCGKTTQVPQFIFEEEINNNRGAFANIVVTQPRRISAISMAERVAEEFGEDKVGKSIGFQVRFHSSLPSHNNGAILFCSSGILLRKLYGNPKLKGVSHVIIDEVHERDVIIDFLLVILKRLLKLNPDIRIIMMSASLNAHLFSEYFDRCPVIEIPGRCFPVEKYYINDYVHNLRNINLPRLSQHNPKVDKYFIVELINFINECKPDGAILCFLPGWKEIYAVSEALKFEHNSSLLVIPVHSKLPHAMQRMIFNRPPAGVRKVVLATNIAETSLTIDDVVYVIDPGLANEMRYNKNLNVSAFGTNWISKANARQRIGRAGRVKPGECYKIYSKEIEDTFMDDYPTPELLRIPLESVVMEAKLHFPNESTEKFLSEVPQPPTCVALKSAIEALKSIKVIDAQENLTLLGKRIIGFTTHPRLSVSLVYGSMFKCVASVLNVASHLSATREPFQVMPDEKDKIIKIKERFNLSYLSDHITFARLSSKFESILNIDRESFCSENFLSKFAMENILEVKSLYAQHLENAKIIEKNSWKNTSNEVNLNWNKKQILLASLIPGLQPNFIRLMFGELKNGKINPRKIIPVDANSGKKVKFVKESLLHGKINTKEIDPNNALIIYFNSFYSEDAKMLAIRDASIIPPVSLLLFSENIESNTENFENSDDGSLVVMVDKSEYLRFKINKSDWQIISRWSEILDHFTQWFIMSIGKENSASLENKSIGKALEEFVSHTHELCKSQIINNND